MEALQGIPHGRIKWEAHCTPRQYWQMIGNAFSVNVIGRVLLRLASSSAAQLRTDSHSPISVRVDLHLPIIASDMLVTPRLVIDSLAVDWTGTYERSLVGE
eukprot:6458589-Amphidinium_carterae.1